MLWGEALQEHLPNVSSILSITPEPDSPMISLCPNWEDKGNLMEFWIAFGRHTTVMDLEVCIEVL